MTRGGKKASTALLLLDTQSCRIWHFEKLHTHPFVLPLQLWGSPSSHMPRKHLGRAKCHCQLLLFASHKWTNYCSPVPEILRFIFFYIKLTLLEQQLFQVLYFRNEHLKIDFFRHISIFGDFPQMVTCPREIRLEPELLGVNLLASSAYLSS